MDKLFSQLSTIEQDQTRLESIRQLESAFNEVKASYAQEYDATLTNVIEHIKDKLKKNAKVRNAVEKYVYTYVRPEAVDEAMEVLYGMLAAELAQTMQALTHTSCTVM